MEVVQFPKLGLEFNVSRVAFSIGGFDIYWYGLLIGAGLLLAMLFALKKSKEFGLDQNKFIDVIIVGIIGGVIGARLYYVAFSPRDDFSTLRSILDIRNGGMGFYGAVIGGVLFAVIMAKIRKVKILPVMDLVGIGFLLGQGIGRWGNFANQEAFGTNTDLPWGMHSEAIQRYIYMHSEELAERGIRVFQYSPVHPTFLYESLWCILGFILLTAYIKHRKFDGEIFLMFLFWNGFLRMFIEGLRLDSLYIGNVRVSQLLAALMAFGALAAIILIRNKIKLSGNPDYLKPYGHTAAWAEEYRLILEKEEAEKNKKKSSKKNIEEDAREGAVLNGEDQEKPVAEVDSGEEASDETSEEPKSAEAESETAAEAEEYIVGPSELAEAMPVSEPETEPVTAENAEEEKPAEEIAVPEEIIEEEKTEETAKEEKPETEAKAEETEAAPKKKTTRKKSTGSQNGKEEAQKKSSGTSKKSSAAKKTSEGSKKSSDAKKSSDTSKKSSTAKKSSGSSKKSSGTKKTEASEKTETPKKRSSRSSKAKAAPAADTQESQGTEQDV